MDVREVDWSTAEVTDKRTLTVVLAGESDARWCGAFTTAAGLLDAASHNHLWGGVEARARKSGDQIIVNELEIDDPEHVKSLREFVDAVARQASSSAPVAQESADPGHGDNPAGNSTRAFRALAPDGQTRNTP
jgi:hypothetical protein